jgi:outer membrane receptor protein involved in Fe transport
MRNSRRGIKGLAPPRIGVSSLSAAVFLALYGTPRPAPAQQQQSVDSSSQLSEIVVTATRREVSLEAVPYSISAISADQIERTGVVDIASLSQQVPGLSMYDFGLRLSGSVTPIIRGINATGESVTRPFRTFEQSPVGVYIDNSPIDGYFTLDDIQRIEVLRGPQGTLYGAGALGGALRVITNAPELGKWSGRVDASAGQLSHSAGTPYTASAMINIPIGDTLAFRASGKYSYEPGFIDVYGIVKRTGSQFYGAPVLADPADPVNSPAIYTGKLDWNDSNAFTGRAALLWKPADNFSAEASVIYSNLNGVGGPVVNDTFKGGPYFIDPRITFPAGGDYKLLSAWDQPYWRHTSLSALDVSYDAGFATVSSTSSYYTVNGLEQDDGSTYGVAGFPGLSSYYAGSPFNPRFIYGQWFTDSAHTFTEELRLVSNTGSDKAIDYVIGLFYENQARFGDWYTSTPGSYQRSVAQGCTGYFYFGASYPNCLLRVGPNDVPFTQFDAQSFQDKSVFGELTWHFLKNGQITFGGRHFKQEFTDAQSYTDYTFLTFVPATPHSAPASKNTWKINPSYEYADHQYVYATWSQGFRRGGANSVPLVGIFRESPALASYQPDSINNYELGLKGRLANGTSYTVALFDMLWDKPQISASLPSGNLAVYNGNKAQSKGLEFEVTGPLVLEGLRYTVGGAYTDAKLTGDFSLPANCGCGTGQIVPGLVVGYSGEVLPGSPKYSAAATLIYDRMIVPDYVLSVSLNGTYRSLMHLYLAENSPAFGDQSQYKTAAYGIANFSAMVSHLHWRGGVYVTNLLDKRAVLVPGVVNSFIADAPLATSELINTPREAGVRLGYSF